MHGAPAQRSGHTAADEDTSSFTANLDEEMVAGAVTLMYSSVVLGRSGGSIVEPP